MAAEEITVGDWRVTVAPPGSPGAAPPREPPSLSVIITYYRGQGTVAQAVRSVLEQTVAPSEIVICDDGSPDDIDAGLGELRERVTVVRKPNGGTGSALNAAAREARGDYLVQLDVDDAFCPRRIEAVAAVLAARPDVDIVCSDALVESRGETVATVGEMNPCPERDHRALMLVRNWIPWPAARRSLVLEAGGWDERLLVFEDWDCWLRAVIAGARVAYVHEPLYRWRISPDSRSSASRASHYSDQVLFTEKALASGLLDADERRLAESLLAQRRRALMRARARDAVAAGSPGARRMALELMRSSGVDRATRAKAAIAAVSPGLARRLRERGDRAADPLVLELRRRGFELER